MKNKVTEKHPNIKVVTVDNIFQPVIDRYKEESILRDSKDFAELITEDQNKSNINNTDLFIICCNADNELEKEITNDLLIKAKKNGSEFFTSVVITYGSATDDDFKPAAVIFPIGKDQDFKLNVVRLLQLLVEISIKQGIGAVDFGDIKTLLHYRGIGFFKFCEIKEEKGSAIKLAERLIKDPVISQRLKGAAGVIIYFYFRSEESYEDIGEAVGMLGNVIRQDCNILFSIIDGETEDLQISLVIVDDKI